MAAGTRRSTSWAALGARWSESEADAQMVDVLMLVRERGSARVELVVRGALAAGQIDGRTVAILSRRTTAAAPVPRLDGLDARLQDHERLEPRLTGAFEALIDAHAVELKLPTVRRRFRQLAEEAVREQQATTAYLAALLEGRDDRPCQAVRETRADRAVPSDQTARGFPVAAKAAIAWSKGSRGDY